MIPLARMLAAREVVATLIASGETEALPIFERIEAEIAQAERAESAIARARTIAEGGRFKVAADRRRRPAA